jgi:hypothetical protein
VRTNGPTFFSPFDFLIFILKNCVCQDRLGTNIQQKTHQKNGVALSQVNKKGKKFHEAMEEASKLRKSTVTAAVAALASAGGSPPSSGGGGSGVGGESKTGSPHSGAKSTSLIPLAVQEQLQEQQRQLSEQSAQLSEQKEMLQTVLAALRDLQASSAAAGAHGQQAE